MKLIHKVKKSGLVFLLFMISLSSHPAAAAYAAQDISVVLSLSQRFISESKEQSEINDVVVYQLTGESTDTPMPEGSSRLYRFSVTGSQDLELGTITYVNPGTYEYDLEPVTTETSENYIYQKEIYHITVYVSIDGKGTMYADMIIQNSDGMKTTGLNYQHCYREGDRLPSPGIRPAPGGTTDGVKTGDDAIPLLWIIVLICSFMIVLKIFRYFGKQRNQSPV